MREPENKTEGGLTLKAAWRAQNEHSRFIIKPGEMIEARFAHGASLSVSARKMLALLIAKAGGDALKDGYHTITKKELRGSHRGNERVSEVLKELVNVKFIMRTTSARGKPAVLTSALITQVIEETSEDGMATVEWTFSDAAIQVFSGSDFYGRINRAALLQFRSKYGIALYELGGLLVGKRDPTWKGSVDELRERIGVETGVLTNFAQFRSKVLDKAKSEIDQLAHFNFDWTEKRGGRGGKIVGIELRFTLKDQGSIDDAAREIDRHSAGRKARREGTVEHIAAEPSAEVIELPPRGVFPEGSLHYCTDSRLNAIVVDFGGGWDRDVVAAEYRSHMGDKLATLRGEALYKSFEGFCRSFAKRRKRS
jgi:hypothetical protein